MVLLPMIDAKRFLAAGAAILLSLVLSGCGGGAGTESLPPPAGPAGQSNYSGPAPATADVQSFMVNLWDNIRSSSRCGGCHNTSVGQTPMFAREDDVNLAYESANTIVDLNLPSNSRMVAKVAGGHNCWLSSDQACADIITTWIENWAGGTGSSAGRTIQLEAPADIDVGTSKSFPADSALFAATVHPLLTTYCAGCHSPASGTPQQPYFADNDVNSAYDAAKPKINLSDPAASRLVIRLRDEFHNCWSDCQSNAAEIQTQIEAFAGQIPDTVVDPQLVISKALTLYDGTIASGGNRYESSQIALYEFKTGLGTTAFDTSGVDPAIDLTLSGNVVWVGGWGINLIDGKAQGSTTASRKLHDLIRGTGEYSIEAWVAPANVAQEDTRIVSYSGGPTARNFNLGQTTYFFDFYNRSSMTDGNGSPVLNTTEDDNNHAALQHIVATYDPINGRRIYHNGELASDPDANTGGTLTDWDDTFAFVLGNEVSGDSPWAGVLRLVAVHNRALTQEQIIQNFDVGVGEKYFLLFNVTEHVGVPQSYIMFEVSQYDSYSYLFNRPVFISLDANAQPDGIPIVNMRIGINGAEAVVGQAYRNMATQVTSANYDSTAGQQLSTLGTVIALEQGPDSDQFFLTFEQLGSSSNVVTEPAVLAPPPPPDGLPQSDIGLRTFEEINATMSFVTTVPTTEPNVQATFQLVKQQLPTVEQIDTFVSAHEIGVAQLAIEYCNALVADSGLRTSYFSGFNFGAIPSVAFGGANRDNVIQPLINNVMNVGVGSQPDYASVETELSNLIDRLIAADNSSSQRTQDITKAVCAGILGSGVMLLQ